MAWQIKLEVSHLTIDPEAEIVLDFHQGTGFSFESVPS